MKIQKAINQNASPSAPQASTLLGKLKGIKTSAPQAPQVPQASTLLGKLKGIKTSAPQAPQVPPSAPPDISALISALMKQSGKIQEGMNITLEKFAEVELMREEIEALKKEVIESKQLLAVYCATYQKMESESNALAVDSAKNIRAIMAELNTIKQIRGELKQAPQAPPSAGNAPQVINRKAPQAPSAGNAPLDSEALYRSFMAYFGGSFCGSLQLDHLGEFERLIEALPESTDIQALDKAIRAEWTKKRSEGSGQYCAAKSLFGMVSAIIQALQNSGIIPLDSGSAPPAAGNAPPSAPPAGNAPPRIINASSLGKLFQLDATELREFTDEIKAYYKEFGNIPTRTKYTEIMNTYRTDNGIDGITDQDVQDMLNFALK